MEEVSTCFGLGSGTPVFSHQNANQTGYQGVWQAARVYKLGESSTPFSGAKQPTPVPPAEATIELSYFVSALADNIDIISRFDIGRDTGGMLHADEAGERAFIALFCPNAAPFFIIFFKYFY
jgi:hypothetical protein